MTGPAWSRAAPAFSDGRTMDPGQRTAARSRDIGPYGKRDPKRHRSSRRRSRPRGPARLRPAARSPSRRGIRSGWSASRPTRRRLHSRRAGHFARREADASPGLLRRAGPLVGPKRNADGRDARRPSPLFGRTCRQDRGSPAFGRGRQGEVRGLRGIVSTSRVAAPTSVSAAAFVIWANTAARKAWRSTADRSRLPRT